MNNYRKNLMNIILNEEVYNRPELKIVDKEFEKVLEKFEKNPEKDLNALCDKEFETIKSAIFKMMNCKILLQFDLSPKKMRGMTFGMCTYPNLMEMYKKAVDCAEHSKKGFRFKDIPGVIIVKIDWHMLNIFLAQEDYDRKFYGRACTAILLHELGHTVYIESQRNQYKNYKDTYFHLKIFGIEIFVPKIFLRFYLGLAIINNQRIYIDTEHLSDLVAVKYGYGLEIFRTMDIFYKMWEKDKRFSKIFNKKQQAELDSLRASRNRQLKILAALKKELKDPKNNEEAKKKIREMIAEIEKILKDGDDGIENAYAENWEILIK